MLYQHSQQFRWLYALDSLSLCASLPMHRHEYVWSFCIPHTRHLSTPETPSRAHKMYPKSFRFRFRHWCGISLLILFFLASDTTYLAKMHTLIISHFRFSFVEAECMKGFIVIRIEHIVGERGLQRQCLMSTTSTALTTTKTATPPTIDFRSTEVPQRPGTMIIIYSDKKIHWYRCKVFGFSLREWRRDDQVGTRMSTHSLAHPLSRWHH